MNKIEATAIICARKNSKGIENKNMAKLSGKPLVQICIEQALRCIENVVVTSDSDQVLQIASSFDSVFTIERPSNLAEDTTPKVPVLQHAVNQLEKITVKANKIIYDLQATSPLRSDESIFESFNHFFNIPDASNLVSISRSSFHPEYNLVTRDENSKIKLLEEPADAITGRNLLPNTYAINGSIYIWRRDSLMKNINNKIVLDGTVSFETDPIQSIDIDTKEDFYIVESIINNKTK